MHEVWRYENDALIFSTFIEKPKIKLFEVEQVHGHKIVDPQEGETRSCKADGLICDHQTWQRALAIKTADCMPVVFEGEKTSALLHVGWRGLAASIHLQEKIVKLCPKTIVVGPCIGGQAYQVQDDFKKNFPHSKAFQTKDNKLFFNLVTELKSQVQDSYPKAKFIASELCTYRHPNLHSFRQNATKKRNWNILQIKATEL